MSMVVVVVVVEMQNESPKECNVQRQERGLNEEILMTWTKLMYVNIYEPDEVAMNVRDGFFVMSPLKGSFFSCAWLKKGF